MALKEVSKAVSIHASAWEATLRDGKLVGISEPFQSTPPRGRRRVVFVRVAAFDAVSIHASAWEATRRTKSAKPMLRVSIHASAWEATGSGNGHGPVNLVSIHASAWEATLSPLGDGSPGRVSIHASAWEATVNCKICPCPRPSFNPRLRVGGDCITYCAALLNELFVTRRLV